MTISYYLFVMHYLLLVTFLSGNGVCYLITHQRTFYYFNVNMT